MFRFDQLHGTFRTCFMNRRSFVRKSIERCLRVSASIILLMLIVSTARASMSGGDVMATVEGSPITRRELTYYWLRVDAQLPGTLLGAPLVDAWVASPASRSYTLTEAQIYARLYGPLATPKPAALEISARTPTFSDKRAATRRSLTCFPA